MNTKNEIIMKSLVVASVLLLSMSTFKSFASESVSDNVVDAKTDTKKNYRKMKRKIRNATGNGSMSKDFKDGANDVSDEIKGVKKKTTN